MSILKYLYPKTSLKRKILDIRDDIKELIVSRCNEKISVLYIGAVHIDPKNLAYWIWVKTDKTKLGLNSDALLMTELMQLFIKNDYPEDARSLIGIRFESQETVDRESGGSWHEHMK